MSEFQRLDKTGLSYLIGKLKTKFLQKGSVSAIQSKNSGTVSGSITIDGVTTDIYCSDVSYTDKSNQVGTVVGTITIDGTDYDIYNGRSGGGGGGSEVEYTPTLTSGVESGVLNIDGVDYSIYSKEVSFTDSHVRGVAVGSINIGGTSYTIYNNVDYLKVTSMGRYIGLLRSGNNNDYIYNGVPVTYQTHSLARNNTRKFIYTNNAALAYNYTFSPCLCYPVSIDIPVESTQWNCTLDMVFLGVGISSIDEFNPTVLGIYYFNDSSSGAITGALPNVTAANWGVDSVQRWNYGSSVSAYDPFSGYVQSKYLSSSIRIRLHVNAAYMTAARVTALQTAINTKKLAFGFSFAAGDFTLTLESYTRDFRAVENRAENSSLMYLYTHKPGIDSLNSEYRPYSVVDYNPYAEFRYTFIDAIFPFGSYPMCVKFNDMLINEIFDCSGFTMNEVLGNLGEHNAVTTVRYTFHRTFGCFRALNARTDFTERRIYREEIGTKNYNGYLHTYGVDFTFTNGTASDPQGSVLVYGRNTENSIGTVVPIQAGAFKLKVVSLPLGEPNCEAV